MYASVYENEQIMVSGTKLEVGIIENLCWQSGRVITLTIHLI